MSRYSILGVVLGLLPLAALVAVVFWLVFTIRYANEAEQGPHAQEAYEYAQKASVAFQAVVATVLVYFVSHHLAGQVSSMLSRV